MKVVTCGDPLREQRLERRIEVSLDSVVEPGVYLTRRGDLLRVSRTALADLHSQRIARPEEGEPRLTLLAGDPDTPLAICRTLAHAQGLLTNF